MKENHDPHQIVISREYFEELVRIAQRKDTNLRTWFKDVKLIPRILWHVRKYNTAYKAQQAILRETKQKEWNELRSRVIDLIKNYEDKVVYADTQIPASRHLPMVVMGRSWKSKLHVALRRSIDGRLHEHVEHFHIRNIVTELPEQSTT